MILGRTISTAEPEAQHRLDESELVRRAKALEPKAWEEIFHAYYPRICTFLRYRTGDADAAEDLAAQVFAEAVPAISRYEYRGAPLSAWLYRIARNLSNAHARKERRLPRSSAPEPHVAGPAQHVEQQHESERLVAALDLLTPEQREVLVLRFMDGLSTQATAGIVGKRERAIKALQHRALARMRQILSREEEPPE